MSQKRKRVKMGAQRTLNERDAEAARIDDELLPSSDEAALRRRAERQINKRKEFRTHLLSFVVVNVLLTGMFFMFGIPWVGGIVALAWGAGLMVHGVDTCYQTGARAAIRTAHAQRAFRDDYGPRWYETASRAELRRTLKRVEEPFIKRREFASHLAVFIAINILLWLIYLSVTPDSFPWPLAVTGFWGLGLAAQGVEVLFSSRRQSDIEREVKRQRRLMEDAQSGRQKRKNDDLERGAAAMQIGPDGELIDLVEDEFEEKLKRGQAGE